MKKQLIALLIVVVLVCGVSLIACNNTTIDSYVFDKNNQAVYDDFVLPKTLGDDEKPTQVQWTSSNSEIIKITERESDFLAEIVNFPDKATDITLTLSAGGAKKEFTVTVNPLASSDFARAYSFPQLRSKVAVDFNLDTTVQYKGKTATITWEVVTGAPYIKVEGNKCVVDHQNESNAVSLRATFTYGTSKTTRTYDFTVAKEPTHEEAMHRWHTIAPMEQDLPIKGYIVAIAADYDASYGNASFYMVCEDYCSAYYIYRVKADATNGAKIAVGVHVTVTGTKNQDYNGLFETNAGGKCVVDDTKKINVDEHIYAVDNDLFAAAPTADYHVSDYVSLTNWTVKEVKTAPADATSTKTLMVLTKNDVELEIITSKYMAHHYSGTDDAFKAIAALCGTIKQDDVVTVKGILGKYKGKYQITMVQASDLTKTTADAANTVYPGSEVKETVANIQKAITDNGLNKLVTSNKTVTMPTGSGKISVVYSKYSDSNAVALNDNVITVTPGKSEDVNIKATIKYGDDYTTMVIFNIKSEGKTDAEMVDAELAALTLADIEKVGDVTLVTKGATYEDVGISWNIKGTTTVAATVADGKLKITALPVVETKLTLTATLTKGDVTKTKDIEITVVPSNDITLNGEALGLKATYGDGDATINGVAFSYVELFYKDSGVQMRNKSADGGKVSTIYNTTAFGKKIASVTINAFTGKVGYSNENFLKIEFANNAEFTDAKTVMMSTVKNQLTYEIEIPEGDYTFIRITENLTYTFYLDSLVITLAD